MNAILLLALLATPQDDPAVAVLRDQAVKVRSSDPSDEDFSDLQPLKKILEGRRIVLLGEQSHGEGSVFLAKTRIIKFLHLEMGFDVLAMESGLYECGAAWRALTKGRPARESFGIGVFPIWTFSRQFQPLMDYVAGLAKSESPLELTGFDCQFPTTGGPGWREARETLRSELDAIVKGYATPPLNAAALDSVMAAFDEKPSPDTLKSSVESLARLRKSLEARAPAGMKADDRAMWVQVLESLGAQAENLGRARKGGMLADDFNPRDAQMGKNFVWLAQKRYPKRKIVAWAATMHIARRVEGIQSKDVNYKGVRPMGQVAAESLDREMYVLGFDALKGQRGLVFQGKQFDIERAPAGSLADLASKAGLENAWIDFTRLPEKSPLRRKLVARPLGNAPMEADWSRVVDGMFFQAEVEASRPR